MRTEDIPTTVKVSAGPWADTYTCTSPPSASTWSWYPTANRNTGPHVTVGGKDDVIDSVPMTGFDGSVSTLTKPWWFKLHVSVDINGRNLQMFYKIDANWMVSPCGNSLQHIPSYSRQEALAHARRQKTDYKAFAQAFVDSARKAWIDGIVARNAPPTLNVGPQTSATFYGGL